MTLLGCEQSLLIRSKFRSALKSPAAFQEQRKNLERAKSEEYLKHKVRSRPERSDPINMHILQDSSAEGSVQAAQMKLKRARLADDLNERIALRPGPLELVEKNIIPIESTVKEAMKGSSANYSKPVDAFAFEEDSSNDESPDQEKSNDSQGISSSSPQETKNMDATSSPDCGPVQNHPQETENDQQDRSPHRSHPCSMHPESQLSTIGHVPPSSAAIKNKSTTDSKNRHKKPKDIKPKVKKLKYHQYIPPDQKAEKSPPPMDSAYARLLQQQQLFLQLQILSQQQQQHFSYQGMHHSHLKQPNEQMTRNCNTTMVNSPSLSPVKTTFSGQTSMSPMKPGLLPSNLDDLKVSELRQQLRIRGLPVSGTKTSLMERLRPFQECSGNTVPTFSEITTVTFPVTPNNSSFQTHPSGGVISNGFYQFGSTSSTPPISPASSDLSVSGSLPDTFSDGPMSSPQFGLHPSPIHHLSAEESLMSSINSGSYQVELEGMDAEKDKMLVEKQKVINELTWKLQQEQRQVEELRLQLQKRKGNCGPHDKTLPSQHFFGVPIKQETVSSCPFASKQMTMKTQANSVSEKHSSCTAQPMPCLMNNHCMEASNPSSIMSSTFLSPQCSPQHSPIGNTNSPQHISLPPSPNNHCLLSVSPSSQGDTRSTSPQVNHRIHAAQNTGSSISYSPNQNTLQPSFIDQSENKQNIKERVPPKSPSVLGKISALQPSPQAGQKIPTPGTNYSSVSKQLPSYEDAVRQQITRSQQMDELLDVLIESGEMPANAKEERSCGQKLNPMSVSTGNPSVTTSDSHHPYENCSNNDGHLEVLLNTHSPLGRSNEIPLLKIGNDDPHFERVMEGFPGKGSEEMLETSLSPMETQLSPSSVESNGLHHLSFTESPWETMEWLDLTPPSSATGLGSLTTTGPSIFNTDFLDVTDLNLNNAMDLHLEQW